MKKYSPQKASVKLKVAAKMVAMILIPMMSTDLHPSSHLVMAWHCHWLNTFMAVEMRECFYRTSLTSLVHCTSSLVTLTPSWIYNGVSLIKVTYVLCMHAAHIAPVMTRNWCTLRALI